MSNLEQTLPNTLHELIVLAVKDMKLTEKDKRYYISMMVWHYPPTSQAFLNIAHILDGKRLKKAECVVCMAGCVMAQTLEVPIEESKSPLFFGGQKNKLAALDCIGDYNIQGAVNWMNGNSFSMHALQIHDFVINKLYEAGRKHVKYSVNKKQFYSNMLFIAKILKSQNI